VAEALDVLGHGDGFLDVLVVGGVVGEDGIVDDGTVDGGVLVCADDFVFEEFFVDGAEVELEAAFAEGERASALRLWEEGVLGRADSFSSFSKNSLLLASLLGPLGVLYSSRVVIGKKGRERRLLNTLCAHGAKGLLDLSEEVPGDGFGQHDLAGLGDGSFGHCEGRARCATVGSGCDEDGETGRGEERSSTAEKN